MLTIQRHRYPELDKLLWDIHNDSIAPETAFRAYEDRWQFVDEQKLGTEERALIKQLTQTIGNGIFTPTFG